MNKFEVGQKLSTRSLCDYDCIYTAEVLKRTPKTVTIKDSIYGEKRLKIHVNYDGNESVFPHGRHSMAPTFVAGRTA